jgi:phosphoribosyl 1,2-cyclic phosphodiesterase
MGDAPATALRIHIYGTQGSGSIFPSRAERRAFQRQSDQQLLRLVFEDLERWIGPGRRGDVAIEDILGGPLEPRTIAAYRDRFDVPEPRVYGGWTTCVRVETGDGCDLVFDCGSGFRPCAADLQAKWADRPERHLHLFGSHSHLDHTEGFDQAAVCFDPRNHLHIYGNRQFLRALDFNLGIFSRQVEEKVQGVQTPIFFGVMPARFHACVIGAGTPEDADAQAALHAAVHGLETPIRIGATTITAFEVWHPAPCLAYRVEHAGRVLVFCTDHELYHGDPGDPNHDVSRAAESRLIGYTRGADVLYRDGQYLRAEYDGLKGIGTSAPIPRAGWGHSCIEDVIEMAGACGVRHTVIGHHDPNRDWSERNWLDESMARRGSAGQPRVEFARAETVIDLPAAATPAAG